MRTFVGELRHCIRLEQHRPGGALRIQWYAAGKGCVRSEAYVGGLLVEAYAACEGATPSEIDILELFDWHDAFVQKERGVLRRVSAPGPP